MNDHDWIRPFVAKLRVLDPPDKPQDTKRAELAHLRRGVGKPAVETLGKLGWVFAEVAERNVETAVLVAGLFAIHSAPHGKGTLGTSLGKYKLQSGADESTDKRFAHLVDSGREDLPERLRHVVRLLKSKDVPVDWFRLTEDLLGWDRETRSVQWNWSRDYWRSNAAIEESTEPEAQTLAPTS